MAYKVSGEISCEKVLKNPSVSQLESAMNSLTSGRNWQEWIGVRGSVNVTSKIDVPAYTGLDLRGAKFTLGYDGDMFGNASGAAVQDDWVTIVGGFYDGLKATYATVTNDCVAGVFRHVTCRDMFIHKFAGYGLHFWSVDTNNRAEGWIDKNWIGDDAAANVNGGGIWLAHDIFASTDWSITENLMINNGTRPFLNLDIGCAKDSMVTGNHVAGNVNGAIAIYGSGSVHDLQIIGNHFEFIKRNAIYFYEDSNGEYVAGNVIVGNVFRDCCYEADNTYDTVYLGVDGASTAVCRGNVVNGNVFRVDASANRARYLVHLDSALSDSNTVVGNCGVNSQAGHWDAPYGTAGCQDDGTNDVAHNMWL